MATNEAALDNLNHQPFLRFLVSPRFRIYRYLILLIFLAFIPYDDKLRFRADVDLYIRLGIFTFFMLVLLLNMYLLVPRLLFTNRYLPYFIAVLLLISLSYATFYIFLQIMQPYHIGPITPNNRPIRNLFGFILFFGAFFAASSAVKVFQRWVLDSYQLNELQKSTMQSELEQLKNQINPHFLFNTLNNANVLVQRDPEKASQVLMKLSDLLRYQLYDSTRQQVLLTADIHFITDFLNLEKIRRDNFEFLVSKEGNINGIQIPPFLFITFVENAIKHNMDAEKQSYVHVYFRVQAEALYFTCINSKPEIPAVRSHNGGLGLSNVQRRLQLLYGNNGQLEIKEDPATYQVNLIIKL